MRRSLAVAVPLLAVDVSVYKEDPCVKILQRLIPRDIHTLSAADIGLHAVAVDVDAVIGSVRHVVPARKELIVLPLDRRGIAGRSRRRIMPDIAQRMPRKRLVAGKLLPIADKLAPSLRIQRVIQQIDLSLRLRCAEPQQLRKRKLELLRERADLRERKVDVSPLDLCDRGALISHPFRQLLLCQMKALSVDANIAVQLFHFHHRPYRSTNVN